MSKKLSSGYITGETFKKLYYTVEASVTILFKNKRKF